jgi:hypothetical protein
MSKDSKYPQVPHNEEEKKSIFPLLNKIIRKMREVISASTIVLDADNIVLGANATTTADSGTSTTFSIGAVEKLAITSDGVAIQDPVFAAPPVLDNTQTQVLARNSTSGAIVRRNDIVDTHSIQTVAGKIMDYNNNTFINFPSSGGGLEPTVLEYTHTWSGTWFSGTATTNCIYTKLGNVVTMFTPGFLRPVTAAGYLYSDPVPAPFRPVGKSVPIPILIDINGNYPPSQLIYDDSGSPSGTCWYVNNTDWLGGNAGLAGFLIIYQV